MNAEILIVLAKQMCMFCQCNWVVLMLHLLKLCEGSFFSAYFILRSTWIVTHAPHEAFF